MRASGKIERATDDEIVQAITSSLKKWKPQLRQLDTGDQVEMSDDELLTEISTAARAEIDRLRNITVPNFFGREAIRKTREDARDIIKSIDQLNRQLSARTLSPELQERLGLRAFRIGTRSDVASMPVPRLQAALKDISDICQAAVANQPGTDQVKLWCVKKALNLMLRFSQERPSAGSADSPYCIIASLLYESVTGKTGHQLRRICQHVLRPYLPLLPA